MLTDTHCRNAKPKPKLYRLTDHRGLCLEVKPSGVKAWRYRFTLEGKASMFALGEYPAVSLAEARDRCEAARQLVKQGINPAQQRQIDRIKQASDAEITFEKVAREWLQTKDWEDVTKNRRLDMLERYIRSRLCAPLALADLAGAAGVSVRALNALCHQQYGVAPMDLLRNIRLDAVRERLLTHPGANITDTAFEFGFGHLGRFSAYYRERFGELPKQTRSVTR